jgi:hypothetical protein
MVLLSFTGEFISCYDNGLGVIDGEGFEMGTLLHESPKKWRGQSPKKREAGYSVRRPSPLYAKNNTTQVLLDVQIYESTDGWVTYFRFTRRILANSRVRNAVGGVKSYVGFSRGSRVPNLIASRTCNRA